MKHVAVAVLSMTVALAACTGGSGDPAASGSDGDAGSTARPGPSSTRPRPTVTLRVGVCFDTAAPDATQRLTRSDIAPADCAAPHHFELFATLVHPSGAAAELPKPAALDAYATDQCLLRFEGYVGQGYERSALDLTPVVPDKDAWEAGDRELACAAYRSDFEPLVGSVAHTGL